jgi:hypothetical protein
MLSAKVNLVILMVSVSVVISTKTIGQSSTPLECSRNLNAVSDAKYNFLIGSETFKKKDLFSNVKFVRLNRCVRNLSNYDMYVEVEKMPLKDYLKPSGKRGDYILNSIEVPESLVSQISTKFWYGTSRKESSTQFYTPSSKSNVILGLAQVNTSAIETVRSNTDIVEPSFPFGGSAYFRNSSFYSLNFPPLVTVSKFSIPDPNSVNEKQLFVEIRHTSASSFRLQTEAGNKSAFLFKEVSNILDYIKVYNEEGKLIAPNFQVSKPNNRGERSNFIAGDSLNNLVYFSNFRYSLQTITLLSSKKEVLKEVEVSAYDTY